MLQRLIKRQLIHLSHSTFVGQRVLESGFWLYKSLKLTLVNFSLSDSSFTSNITKSLFKKYNWNRAVGPKKQICYAPFNNLHFQMNGDVSGCSFNYDFYLGNIFEESIESIWKGVNARKFREKLSNFDLDKCQTCQSVLLSKNYQSFPAAKYDEYGSDYSEYPTQVSFELSNKCNFECIMCNEEFSSSIASRKGISNQLHKDFPDSFYSDFVLYAKHLKIATFIGGEPLLIKQYYKLWDIIIKENKKCRIHVQTNGSILPAAFIELLKSSQFDLGFSMDACEKTLFEKIRLNSNYDVVKKNFEEIIQIRNQYGIYVNVNFCPLTVNWKNIPDMILFANHYDVSLKIVNVDNPKNLSLSSQNQEYLTCVEEYLNENLSRVLDESNIIRKRNYLSYASFVTYIRSLKEEAVRRLEYMTSKSQSSIDLTLGDLNTCIQTTENFYNFSVSDKELIYNSLHDHVKQLTDQPSLQVRTLQRFIYSINISQHRGDGKESRIVSEGLKMARRKLNEFYSLELANS